MSCYGFFKNPRDRVVGNQELYLRMLNQQAQVIQPPVPDGQPPAPGAPAVVGGEGGDQGAGSVAGEGQASEVSALVIPMQPGGQQAGGARASWPRVQVGPRFTAGEGPVLVIDAKYCRWLDRYCRGCQARIACAQPVEIHGITLSWLDVRAPSVRFFGNSCIKNRTKR